MATLQAIVYRTASNTAHEVPLNTINLTIGASSVQSGDVVDPAATNGRERRSVRFVCDTDCQFIYGPGGQTADANGLLLGPTMANGEYLGLEAGWNIAVIEKQV